MSANFEVLPKDLLELQLGQVDLLMAMYESDGAVFMDTDSQSLLDELRSWCEADESKPICVRNTTVSLVLNISLDECGDDSSAPCSLGIELSVPIAFRNQSEAESSSSPEEPPRIKPRIQKPTWMSKTQTTQLTDAIQDEEDILAVIEKVKELASHLLQEARLEETGDTGGNGSAYNDSQPLVRVWFYFPSISTRAKRDDLINYGPAYGLTGFLLAGKPGILCLEGGSQAIDEYMKFIKTESWGDIPPQHKKVSERHRETGTGLSRLFKDMQEITDVMGERRGERANRGDMKALEAWLEAHGIGSDVFGKVLF